MYLLSKKKNESINSDYGKILLYLNYKLMLLILFFFYIFSNTILSNYYYSNTKLIITCYSFNKYTRKKINTSFLQILFYTKRSNPDVPPSN